MWRQHADHGVIRSIQLDGGAGSIHPAAQSLLPEALRHNHGRNARPGVAFGEIAAQRRRDSERAEVRPRDRPAAQQLRRRAIAVRHRSVGKGGNALELRLLLFEGLIVDQGKAKHEAWRVGVDPPQARRILIRERAQQRGVHGGVNHRRRANADADRQEDGRRQDWGAQERAKDTRMSWPMSVSHRGRAVMRGLDVATSRSVGFMVRRSVPIFQK